MHIKSIASIICLLVSSFNYSWANEEEVVRADFRVLPVLNATWRGIYYQENQSGDMTELEFRSLARSFDTYKYVGPNPIKFYRTDGYDDEGNLLYKEVGAALVSSDEMLFVFKPNTQASESSALEFSVSGISDGPDTFPIDHISFINFTGIPLLCRFLNEDRLIRDGVNTPISLQSDLEEDLFIGLLVQNETTQRIVLKNSWRFNPGNRHLILLLPPKKSGSFRIRAYRVTEYVGENSRFNKSWTPNAALSD